MIRIYQNIPLKIHEKILLDENNSHHLGRVLRVKLNENIIIFNGCGGEFSAHITAINKKHIEIFIDDFMDVSRESPLQLHLGQGIAKGEKMDYIIQKAVELGAAAITPIITDRSTVRIDAGRQLKRQAHWQAIMINAAQQCGRTLLPTLHPPLALAAWLAAVKCAHKFVLSPHTAAKSPFSQAPLDIALLIGPEGGLSAEEIALAETTGFTPLNLGPRILRTETASIAALTFFQTEYGDMS